MVEGRPDLEAVAILQRNLQVALIELGTARFEYLLDRDPSRLVLTAGLSALMNFVWSDADTEAFVGADPHYVAMEERVSVLRQRNDDHQDWPALRQYFRTDLMQGAAYETLLRDFNQQQETVSAMLEERIP